MRKSFLLALALPAASLAGPPAYYFDLTGEQFVKMMGHPEPLSAEHYIDRERAYRYLDGAKDATVGKAWCPARPRKTFELAYDAADHIKALPAEQRRGNAALLLLDFLARQYPCMGARQ